MGPKWEAYRKALKDRAEAEEWLRRFDAKDWPTGKPFSLSSLHASIKLTLCGQYSAGSKNYWESPDALGRALLEVIHDDPLAFIELAIGKLKSVERDALLAAREEVESVMRKIAAAEAFSEEALTTKEPADA
jgi:hypothetical protein